MGLLAFTGFRGILRILQHPVSYEGGLIQNENKILHITRQPAHSRHCSGSKFHHCEETVRPRTFPCAKTRRLNDRLNDTQVSGDTFSTPPFWPASLIQMRGIYLHVFPSRPSQHILKIQIAQIPADIASDMVSGNVMRWEQR